jgi:hypothetical protein
VKTTLTRLAVLGAFALGGTFGLATAANADTVCHMVADINAPGGERQVCEEHNGEGYQPPAPKATDPAPENVTGGADSTGTAPKVAKAPKTVQKQPKAGSGQQSGSGQSVVNKGGGTTTVITAQPDGSVTVVEMPTFDWAVGKMGHSRDLVGQT